MSRKSIVTPIALARASIADGGRPRMEKAIQRALSALWSDMTDHLLKHGTLPEVGASADRMADVQRGALAAMCVDGLRLGRAELGGKSAIVGARGKALTLDEIEEAEQELQASTAGRRLAQRVDKYLERTSKLEVATSRARIEDIYRAAVRENRTPTEVAQALLDSGVTDSANRATMLARTTSIWAYNSGAEESYHDAGVEQKEWLTGEDELTCPFCAAMNGTRVGVGGAYHNAGSVLRVDEYEMELPFDVQVPPLHPNCRCAIVPVI